MHFELDRRLSERRARRPAEARAEDPARRATCGAGLRADAGARAPHDRDGPHGAPCATPPQEVGETVDFLDWLLQLNFVLLGLSRVRVGRRAAGPGDPHGGPGSGLGILSDVEALDVRRAHPARHARPRRAPAHRGRRPAGLQQDQRVLDRAPPRAHGLHRRAPGERRGRDRRRGAAARACSRRRPTWSPATKTPLLHHKLEQILAAEDLIPGSHDYKEVVELFESFPKDELFQASTAELRRLVMGLLQLEKHGGIRVLVRRDLYGRSVSIVVALPRDRFNATLRKRLQHLFIAAVPRHPPSTTTSRWARPRTRASSSRCTSTRACRSPRSRTRSWRPTSSASRARGTTTCWTPSCAAWAPSAAPRSPQEWGPRFPTYYKASSRVGPDRRRRAGPRGLERASRGLPRGPRQRVERRAPHAREALQDRRQGRPVGVHADPGGPRPARRRGDPHRASRARGRSTSTTSACWTRAARCSSWSTRPSASRTRSRPCGAARPSPTR